MGQEFVSLALQKKFVHRGTIKILSLKGKTLLTLKIFFLQTVISTMKAYQLICLSGQTTAGQVLITKL